MAINQMDLIQSLGEAMSWLQREVSWHVAPTEMSHLCGRIGELYAAVITNGQMALSVHQKGYDVVGADGERISVKTTAQVGNRGHVAFNDNTLPLVDRVMVFRINVEDKCVETLLDADIAQAMQWMNVAKDGKRTLSLRRLQTRQKERESIAIVNSQAYQNYVVNELETGAIEVCKDGHVCPISKQELHSLASTLAIPTLNADGNALNTRELGNLVIQRLKSFKPAVDYRFGPMKS